MSGRYEVRTFSDGSILITPLVAASSGCAPGCLVVLAIFGFLIYLNWAAIVATLTLVVGGIVGLLLLRWVVKTWGWKPVGFMVGIGAVAYAVMAVMGLKQMQAVSSVGGGPTAPPPVHSATAEPQPEPREAAAVHTGKALLPELTPPAGAWTKAATVLGGTWRSTARATRGKSCEVSLDLNATSDGLAGRLAVASGDCSKCFDGLDEGRDFVINGFSGHAATLHHVGPTDTAPRQTPVHLQDNEWVIGRGKDSCRLRHKKH